MADCSAERTQGDEEAGAAVVAPMSMRAAPVPVEVREVLLTVVVEAPASLADHLQRPDREGVWAELLEGAGALLPYLVDGSLNVARDLQLHRVIQSTAILQEDEELPDDLGVGWPRVSP